MTSIECNPGDRIHEATYPVDTEVLKGVTNYKLALPTSVRRCMDTDLYSSYTKLLAQRIDHHVGVLYKNVLAKFQVSMNIVLLSYTDFAATRNVPCSNKSPSL